MSNTIDQMFQFQQTALNIRSARQELIASNIVNADTPDYKAKDIDFASALQGALTGNAQKLQVASTSPQHLSGVSGENVLGSPVMYRQPSQPSADGNTVDMDVEQAQFADNAIHYEASLTFVSNDVKNVLAALQG